MTLTELLTELRFDAGNLWVTAVGLVVVLPALAWLYCRKRRVARIRFSSLRNVRGGRASLKLRLRHLPFWLRIVTVAAFLGAFAHPYLEREKKTEENQQNAEEQQEKQEDERKKIEMPTEGISIQLLLDISGSMGEIPRTDPFRRRVVGKTNYMRFEGELLTKLDVVKIISRRFIQGTRDINRETDDTIFTGRSNDMIGLVTFARYPLVACPLTLRHELLLDYISQLDVVKRDEENATYIGYALERCVLQIIDAKSRAQADNAYNIKSSIVILITDGQQNTLEEDRDDRHKSLRPPEAAALAKEHGIKVYTIAVCPRVIYDDNGTANDTRMFPGYNFDTSELEQVAEMTGAGFYRADSGTALMEIYNKIDKLEKSQLPVNKELEVRVEKTKETRRIQIEKIELFPLFLWLGLAGLLADVVLTELYFRRIP